MVREIRQIDIAPTIAKIMGFPFTCDGEPIEEILALAGSNKRVSLIIVDSLGYDEYLNHRHLLSHLSAMEMRGLLFRCLSYSHFTTPSIATILCGLKPENHRILRTEDAYTRTVKCLPEVAYEYGFRVAIVMEEYGALSFYGLVDAVKPITDRADIIDFDEESCYNAVKVLEDLDPNLLIVHFRSLDKLGFNPEVVKRFDLILKKLFSSMHGDSLILICGDHPPHNRVDEKHVALIVFKS